MQRNELVQVCIERYKDGVYEASFKTSQGNKKRMKEQLHQIKTKIFAHDNYVGA